MTCARCGGLCYLDRDLDATAVVCHQCAHRAYRPYQPFVVKREGRQSEKYCKCGQERLPTRSVCRRCYGTLQAKYRNRKKTAP